MTVALAAIFAYILAGFGALAGGIGIFRGGFALGRSAERMTSAFEDAMGKHLDGQERMIALAEQAVPMLRGIQEGQEQIHKELKANDTSMRALWQELRETKGENPQGAR